MEFFTWLAVFIENFSVKLNTAIISSGTAWCVPVSEELPAMFVYFLLSYVDHTKHLFSSTPLSEILWTYMDCVTDGFVLLNKQLCGNGSHSTDLDNAQGTTLLIPPKLSAASLPHSFHSPTGYSQFLCLSTLLTSNSQHSPFPSLHNSHHPRTLPCVV